MTDTRRKFDREFKAGTIRIVREIGRPVAKVARECGGGSESGEDEWAEPACPHGRVGR